MVGVIGQDKVIHAVLCTPIAIALDTRRTLEAEGTPTRVVSMPCWELFRRQDEGYVASILDGPRALVAVEAGGRFGWSEMIGREGCVVGLTGYGASAPGPALYDHFGITAEAVVEAVRASLAA